MPITGMSRAKGGDRCCGVRSREPAPNSEDDQHGNKVHIGK